MVRRGPRVRGEEREALRAELAAGYGRGLSIRVLAADFDLSYGLTRTLLVEANVLLRQSGQPASDGRL